MKLPASGILDLVILRAAAFGVRSSFGATLDT